MGPASQRVIRHALAVAAALTFAARPAAAQLTADQQRQLATIAGVLASTRWCHTSSTGMSLHTRTITFRRDGVLVIRSDTEFGDSHTGNTVTARWLLEPGVLIIHEPNGGVSRLPMRLTRAGSDLRLEVGELTYETCR